MDRTKKIKRLLREQAGAAYEEELRRALLPLAGDFDRRRRGELSSPELSDRIHRFHDGAAREIWKTYHLADPGMSVAYAIHNGILGRESVPAELMPHLGGALAFYRDIDAFEAQGVGEDDDD